MSGRRRPASEDVPDAAPPAPAGADVPADGDAAPPAAPARLGRADRRAQLLAAAQRLFARAGYHGTGMDAIAQRAGITKPVLYRHFPGKRDLYLAVVERSCADLEAAVRAALAPPPDGVADNRLRVAQTVDAYFAFVDEDLGARLVFESDLTSDAAVRARLAALEAACAAAVTDAVVADTALPVAGARVLAVALAGSAQVAARSWVAGGREVPRDEAAALITSLVWRGLRGLPRADRPADRPPDRPPDRPAGRADGQGADGPGGTTPVAPD